jgi:hypothetical protein
MAKERVFKFDTVIEKHPGMNAGYIVFPYDVQESFGKKGRIKVHVTFDGV